MVTQAQIGIVRTISTVAGTSGSFGYSGDGTAATGAALSGPSGVAVDSAGNLYIADTQNSVIRKVSGGVITTLPGAGTSANFADLMSVAVDSAGNVYIADSYQNLIFKVTSAGVMTTAVGSSAGLSSPSGLAVDGTGNLYIADSGNNRILKLDAGTTTVSIVAGTGTPGDGGDGSAATSAQLSSPAGVTVDSAGNIYIADQGNNRVREVAVGTGIISTIAGNGTAGYSGDNAPAISAELNSPTSVAVDLEGNIYIADDVNNRIRKVTAGNISTVTGNGTAGFSGDGKIATSGEVNAPWGIAVDSKGALYIADIGNSVIRMISDNTYFPSTAVGATSASQSILLETTSALNITGISVPVSQGSKQEFNVGTVSGCTVDSTGNTQTASGIVCTVAVSFSPGYPGLRQSPIQVSTVSSGVTVVYPIGINGVGTSPLAAFMPGTVNTVAGTGTSGNSGDGAVATSAQLSSPNGVALDGAGNLFVADTGNHRIRKVSASTGYISTVRPATA